MSEDGQWAASLPDWIVLDASPFSVAQTADRLKRAIAERGMTLYKDQETRDLGLEEAASAGHLRVRDARVLVFGVPRATLHFVVSVWEDKENRVWVRHMDPKRTFSHFQIDPALRPPDGVIETLIAHALQP